MSESKLQTETEVNFELFQCHRELARLEDEAKTLWKQIGLVFKQMAMQEAILDDFQEMRRIYQEERGYNATA